MEEPGQPMDDIHMPSDVLIVEDNFIIALDTEMVLQDLGVTRVRTVSSVAAALAAINERAPDFALIDIDLGGESGFDVGNLLAERKIPFAFATGYAELISPPPALANVQILAKPYSADMLRAVLQSLR